MSIIVRKKTEYVSPPSFYFPWKSNDRATLLSRPRETGIFNTDYEQGLQCLNFPSLSSSVWRKWEREWRLPQLFSKCENVLFRWKTFSTHNQVDIITSFKCCFNVKTTFLLKRWNNNVVLKLFSFIFSNWLALLNADDEYIILEYIHHRNLTLLYSRTLRRVPWSFVTHTPLYNILPRRELSIRLISVVQLEQLRSSIRNKLTISDSLCGRFHQISKISLVENKLKSLVNHRSFEKASHNQIQNHSSSQWQYFGWSCNRQ